MFKLMGVGTNALKLSNNMSEFGRYYTFNTGNLLFNFACQIIANLQSERYSWNTSTEIINSNKFGILLPMANHIGSHFDFSVNGPRIEGIRVPLVVMGIGAQAKADESPESHEHNVPKGTVLWLKTCTSLSKSEKNISARGDFTYQYLKNIGLADKVEVLGCPSLLISPVKDLGLAIQNKFKASNISKKRMHIAIAAGSPFRVQYSSLERSFISWVDEFNASYIVQDPREMIALSNGWVNDVQKNTLDLIRKRWFPHLSNSEIIYWFNKKSTVYISIPQWISDLQKKEIVIGTRIHGIIAGIQAGTPSVCLYVDSRTKELCEFMKIPHAPAISFTNGCSIDMCTEIIANWDYKEFDENRTMIAKKTKIFLENNGVNYSTHLKELCS